MITLTSGDLSFTLQGRTGLAETESGSVTNATVFTAFGAEENGVRVFVGLDSNTNDCEYALDLNAEDTQNRALVQIPETMSRIVAEPACCYVYGHHCRLTNRLAGDGRGGGHVGWGVGG